MKNKLSEMMELQEKFNSQIVPKHEEFWRIMNPFFSKEECMERVKNNQIPIICRLYSYLLHLNIELNELIVNIPIKMWKKQEFNYQEARKEFVDCLHFYLSLFSYDKSRVEECGFSDNWNMDTSTFEENDYEKLIIKNYHELSYDIFQLSDCIIRKIEEENFEIEKIMLHDMDRITYLMREMAQLLFSDFEDLYSEYMKKMDINKKRQENNY